MFSYRSIPVNPLLREVILRYIIFEGNIPGGLSFVQDVIPSLSEFIMFNLNGHPQYFKVEDKLLCFRDCFVTGLHSQPYQATLSGDIKLVGVQIKSPGLSKLFNVPVHYMTNNALTLHDLIGNEAGFVCQKMMNSNAIEESILPLEDFLIQRLKRPMISLQESVLIHSLELIHHSRGTMSIKNLSKQAGTSERRLQRIFVNHVGMAPKMYSSIHRFNEVLWYFNNHKNISTDIIDALGYFDQAHFIHEFKKFSGQSPLAYFKNHPGVNEFFTSL